MTTSLFFCLYIEIVHRNYNDVISEGAEIEDQIIDEKINQQLLSATIAYFGNKFELLAEGAFSSNKAKIKGTSQAFASYIYVGFKLTEQWIPYFRFDNISYEKEEVYFEKDDVTAITAGLRYEINYLTVVKLEYQNSKREISGTKGKLTAQIAIGF